MRVGQEALIDVQRLGFGRVRMRGPGVEAGELEVAAQHVADQRENVGLGDDALKDFAFIDEVGEPPGVGLPLEFVAGVFAFFLKELFDAKAQVVEPGGVDEALENDVAVAVELALLLNGHGGILLWSVMKILVRATNWVGDAVMSLPALAALRRKFPDAHIAVLARPWVADLYGHEPFADEIIPYAPTRFADRRPAAKQLRERGFDVALLLQNAFDAALVAWMAKIPRRIGYARDGRSWLLTDAIAVPKRGEIPPHESFYYLELLRRVGWLDEMPREALIRLEGAERAREAGVERWRSDGVEGAVVGVSPGAAYGNAKRWLPERFAEAALRIAKEQGAMVALFGSGGERDVCEFIRGEIEKQGFGAVNYAGATSLGEFIERAAACVLFLTNDSGAMHMASALGVPTVTVFGATNHVTTGPTGELARVIRHDVECSPCMLRECPLDHRCMKAVSAAEVAETALGLLKLK